MQTVFRLRYFWASSYIEVPTALGGAIATLVTLPRWVGQWPNRMGDGRGEAG